MLKILKENYLKIKQLNLIKLLNLLENRIFLLLRKKYISSFDLIIFNTKKIKWINDNENLIKLFFNINQIIYTNLNTYDLNFVSSGFKFGVSSDNKQDDNNDLDKKIKFFENEISFSKKN